MNPFDVTGTSRGLGCEIARALLAQKCHMLTRARHAHAGLSEAAAASGASLRQWTVDLGLASGIAARRGSTTSTAAASPSATLINNARARAGWPTGADVER